MNDAMTAEDLEIITNDWTGAQVVAEGRACEAIAAAFDRLAADRLADAEAEWDPAWGAEITFERWATTEFASSSKSYRAAERHAATIRAAL